MKKRVRVLVKEFKDRRAKLKDNLYIDKSRGLKFREGYHTNYGEISGINRRKFFFLNEKNGSSEILGAVDRLRGEIARDFRLRKTDQLDFIADPKNNVYLLVGTSQPKDDTLVKITSPKYLKLIGKLLKRSENPFSLKR